MTDRRQPGIKETGREVIFESVQFGRFLKMTALDPETLVEVSIQGPAGADPAALRSAALRKLAYVLRRRGNVG